MQKNVHLKDYMLTIDRQLCESNNPSEKVSLYDRCMSSCTEIKVIITGLVLAKKYSIQYLLEKRSLQ